MNKLDDLVGQPSLAEVYFQSWKICLKRIAVLRATIERLECCGNCTLRYDAPPRLSWDGHECSSRWNGVDGDWDDEDNWPLVKCGDPCHFTPSRWAERSAP